MRTYAALLVALLVAIVTGCTIPVPTARPSVGGTAPDAGLSGRLVDDVTGDGAYRHLVELQRIADVHGGNRALGTPGYDTSVEYVASVLRRAGFDVRTPEFDVRQFSVQDEQLSVAGTPVPVRALGYSPTPPQGGITGPLFATAGEGCDAASLAGAPAGAVVLVRRGTCPFGQKSVVAAGAGAAAVLVVDTGDGTLDGATLGETTTGTVPTAGLNRTDGAALAARTGAPLTLLLATTVQEARSANVVAQTRTGNPDEVVLAGAHLDSVPAGPGINDNGSGVATLLETAVRLGGSPPVTNAVRFAFWGAEEVGLVGSASYVRDLPDAERSRIALYLNLDMVASPNAAYLVYDGDDSDRVGAGPGPAGSAAVERALVEGLAAAGVAAAGTDFDGRSDYGPFIAVGIPAGGLFTGASEVKSAEEARRWGGTAGAPHDPCYHQACDRIDAVDRVALDRNTDAVAATIARFALSTDELATG